MQVGEVIKVEKDSFFPADLLLLSSTNDDGIAYVETVNLDGESNLKIKKALDQTKGLNQQNIATLKVAALFYLFGELHSLPSCSFWKASKIRIISMRGSMLRIKVSY